MQTIEIEETGTGFPIPVATEETASDAMAALTDWAGEQTPSIDELLELRCCSL